MGLDGHIIGASQTSVPDLREEVKVTANALWYTLSRIERGRLARPAELTNPVRMDFFAALEELLEEPHDGHRLGD